MARLYVDEPILAWIMTRDHAKELCFSELGPLRIWALKKFARLID